MTMLTCICVQILFYESANALKATEEKMPIVKDKIPQCEQRRWCLLCYTTQVTVESNV